LGENLFELFSKLDLISLIDKNKILFCLSIYWFNAVWKNGTGLVNWFFD